MTIERVVAWLRRSRASQFVQRQRHGWDEDLMHYYIVTPERELRVHEEHS